MKHYVCKRATGHAAEALECLGGNGYVEESGMPRLLRDSPLNSIWEGSGNVSALDVLRALAKEPEALPAFLAECETARGANAQLDAHLDRIAVRAAVGPRVRGAQRRLRPGGRAPGEPARAARPRRGLGRVLRVAPRERRPRLRNTAARRGHRSHPGPLATRLNTLRYEVTGRVARITLDRPERANAITLDDAARARRVRGGGEPRPVGSRDRARRERARASAAATTSSSTRSAGRRTTIRTRPGTRWWTGR